MSQEIAFRADLHCHSTYSDGTLSPREILELAKNLQLSGLSITDHDSAAAYPNVFTEAEKLEIKMIPGVEFSAMHKGTSVHILGYSFQIAHPSISSLSEKHKQRRKERNALMLNKLKQMGMPILESELHSLHSIGRPHIAQAMLNRGYVTSISEAFNKYLGDNKPCYIKGTPIEVQETLDAIHQANGLAFIAHPHLAKDISFVRELLKMPFDGLECYYARFPKTDHQRWLKLAKEKSLLICGGSDFHGDIKPGIALGSSWIDQEAFQHLWTHYQNNR